MNEKMTAVAMVSQSPALSDSDPPGFSETKPTPIRQITPATRLMAFGRVFEIIHVANGVSTQ